MTGLEVLRYEVRVAQLGVGFGDGKSLYSSSGATIGTELSSNKSILGSFRSSSNWCPRLDSFHLHIKPIVASQLRIKPKVASQLCISFIC